MRFVKGFATCTSCSWMLWFRPIHHPTRRDGVWVDTAAWGDWHLRQQQYKVRLTFLSSVYIHTVFEREVSSGELLRCIMPSSRRHAGPRYTEITVWGPAQPWINAWHYFPFQKKPRVWFMFHVQTGFRVSDGWFTRRFTPTSAWYWLRIIVILQNTSSLFHTEPGCTLAILIHETSYMFFYYLAFFDGICQCVFFLHFHGYTLNLGLLCQWDLPQMMVSGA